jgi:hypothetical protein
MKKAFTVTSLLQSCRPAAYCCALLVQHMVAYMRMEHSCLQTRCCCCCTPALLYCITLHQHSQFNIHTSLHRTLFAAGSLFLVLCGITAVHFSGVMVRLMLVLAPAVTHHLPVYLQCNFSCRLAVPVLHNITGSTSVASWCCSVCRMSLAVVTPHIGILSLPFSCRLAVPRAVWHHRCVL